MLCSLSLLMYSSVVVVAAYLANASKIRQRLDRALRLRYKTLEPELEMYGDGNDHRRCCIASSLARIR
jgi:hypothetical protein